MIKKLYSMLGNPKHTKIMVVTGSGISVASGIPTYFHQLLPTNKDSDIFWDEEEVLNIETLITNPVKLWAWTQDKRKKIVQLYPNINHHALVKLEQHFKERFSLITHNIDNLHTHAGTFRIVEMHGNIFNDKPLIPIGLTNPAWHNIPSDKSGNLLRPDILLQGETVDKKKYLQSHMLAQQCDICIVIGSKLDNCAISDLPLIAKKFNGAHIIEINPEASYIEDADIYIKAPAEKILPLLISLIIEIEQGMKNLSSN